MMRVAALGVFSFLGIIVFVVAFIVSIIRKKSKKIPLIGFAACLVICAVALSNIPTQDQIVNYNVVNSSDYVRDGKQCISYRVAIDSKATETQMRAVYDKVTDDSYYLHTVFFYETEDDIERGLGFTLAELEELEKGGKPVFSLTSYSRADLDSLREKVSEK